MFYSINYESMLADMLFENGTFSEETVKETSEMHMHEKVYFKRGNKKTFLLLFKSVESTSRKLAYRID